MKIYRKRHADSAKSRLAITVDRGSHLSQLLSISCPSSHSERILIANTKTAPSHVLQASQPCMDTSISFPGIILNCGEQRFCDIFKTPPLVLICIAELPRVLAAYGA